jgi:Uncharacterized conserved protein (DUF2358)
MVAMSWVLRAAATLQDRMNFLREDLQHLFDEQGIDRTAYEEKVAFRVGFCIALVASHTRLAGTTAFSCSNCALCTPQDPLSSYNTLSGYLFNIQFLRRIFGPQFTLHDLRRTGDHEITSRWTMIMSLQVWWMHWCCICLRSARCTKHLTSHAQMLRKCNESNYLVQPNKVSPLRRWWDPALVFTGVSIMSLSPESGGACSTQCVRTSWCAVCAFMLDGCDADTVMRPLAGKFISHIDYWDAVRDLLQFLQLCCCHSQGSNLHCTACTQSWRFGQCRHLPVHR